MKKKNKKEEDYDLPSDNELAALANEAWGEPDEDIFDVLRKDMRKPLDNNETLHNKKQKRRRQKSL